MTMFTKMIKINCLFVIKSQGESIGLSIEKVVDNFRGVNCCLVFYVFIIFYLPFRVKIYDFL